MARASPPSAPPDADPFGLWLRRSLDARWGAVVEEEIPADLLRLCSDSRSEWARLRERWPPPTR